MGTRRFSPSLRSVCTSIGATSAFNKKGAYFWYVTSLILFPDPALARLFPPAVTLYSAMFCAI